MIIKSPNYLIDSKCITFKTFNLICSGSLRMYYLDQQNYNYDIEILQYYY